MYRTLATALGFVVLFTTVGMSQTTTGTIEGVVTDPQGRVVANASVTVVNMDTQTTYHLSTDASGAYVATSLQVGKYSVAVETAGFKKAVSDNIVVNVQDRVRLDFHLQLGSVTQSVEVTGATPLLQTDNSYQGAVVSSKPIVDLPLNGRQFQRLAWLVPGVAPSPSGTPDASTGSFSANGNRPFQNTYMLDGVDNRTLLPALSNNESFIIGPAPDAIAEFRVQTNSMSAEFGSAAGAVINMTIRSGTNQLHGTVYEFVRNSMFDAKNFFDSPTNPIPPFRLNQFGGSIGGPIAIPKVYNGKDKTFFFADYQGTRTRTGQTFIATVPPAVWHNGNFSGFRPIYDPQTTSISGTTYTRQPFGNNQILSTRIDPVSAKLMALLPLPNLPGQVSAAGVSNNFLSDPSRLDDNDQFDVRLDHRISDKDQSFLRFSFQNVSRLIPTSLPPPLGQGANRVGNFLDPARSAALSWTHLFTPRTINEFRAGYIWNSAHRLQFNSDVNEAAAIGLPGIPFSSGNGGFPNFGVTGITSFGSGVAQPLIEIQTSFHFIDNLSMVRGRNTIKMGGEFKPRNEFSFLQVIGGRGTFSFSGARTEDPNNTSTTGLGTADFLLGTLSSAGLSNFISNEFQEPAYGFFFQDDIKLTSKLTVNLGARYDFISNVTDKYNAIANFNISNRTLEIVTGRTDPLPANFDSADIPVTRNASRTLVPNHDDHFVPRVGFAYHLFPGTVIRGGYGIFYTANEAGPLSNPNMGLQPPFLRQSSWPAQSVVVPNAIVNQLSQGLPLNAFVAPVAPTFFALDPSFNNPYVQDWHFGFEQDLGRDLLLDVSYSGSKGTRLFEFRNVNEAAPTANAASPIDSRRPMPYLGGGLTDWCSCGSSMYSALEAKLEKRYSNGLRFLTAYTYGKVIDEMSVASFWYGSGADFRDARHPGWERGLADFDLRQRFVLNYSYELPFGRGKKFGGGMNRLADVAAGGWSILGIFALQTGFPLTILEDATPSNSDGQQRGDLKLGVPLYPANHGPSDWYNPAAFSIAAPGTFGNVGKNTLESPGIANLDFSVFKDFQLNERTRLEFRAEFFNLTNHPNFTAQNAPVAGGDSIGVYFDDAGAGAINAAGPSRQIQLALKLIF